MYKRLTRFEDYNTYLKKEVVKDELENIYHNMAKNELEVCHNYTNK